MSWNDILEDLTDVCIDVFSETVEVLLFHVDPALKSVVSCSAVYDSDYKQVDLQTGAIVSSNSPMVEISRRSLPRALSNKDKVKVRGIEYSIKEIQPEASGAIKVMLSRSSSR